MRLRLIGTSSGHTGCPALYATDRGTYVVQGKLVGLDLPDDDFWLIDSTRLAVLRFGADDILLGVEVDDDPAVVVKHCYYRDVAWHYAVPYADYVG